MSPGLPISPPQAGEGTMPHCSRVRHTFVRALMDSAWAQGSDIAAAVREGRTSASAVVRNALARIAAADPVLNAFTAVLEERALATARALDNARLEGRRSEEHTSELQSQS